MSKLLNLSLNRKLIFEAVKADSFINSNIIKANDPEGNASQAYNTAAGDDTYQERKLGRPLGEAVGTFEAHLAEFVDTTVENGGISDTLANVQEDGDFTISVIVSDRYNNGLVQPIAKLAQGYIVNLMLYYWYQPIAPALAKDYLAFSDTSLGNIRLCLAKTAPTTNNVSYDDVRGTVVDSATTTEQLVTQIAFDDNAGVFLANRQLLTSNFANNGYVRIQHTTPGKGFKVGAVIPVDGGGTEKEYLFTIGSTPHELTNSEYRAISGRTEANVYFEPVDGENPEGYVLQIYTRTNATE